MSRRSQAENEVIRFIYETNAGPLFRLALRETGGDRQWAEDVVQETLIRAWRNLDKLRPDGSLLPWLFTVARRIVIDGRRSRSARPREVEDSQLDCAAMSDDMDRALVGLAVRDAMQSLSSAHREVIFELYFRGNTMSGAAEVIGVPPGTIRSRVYHAMRALRAALEDRGMTGST